MELLLKDLQQLGVDIHYFSNYPRWWKLIEQKMGLSRYGKWSFVSAEVGIRKPEKESFLYVADLVGREVGECVLVDDRERNCRAAVEAGFREGVVFTDAESAREKLCKYFEGLDKRK